MNNYYVMALTRAGLYTGMSLILSHFHHESADTTEFFAAVSAAGGWFYGGSMYWKRKAMAFREGGGEG